MGQEENNNKGGLNWSPTWYGKIWNVVEFIICIPIYLIIDLINRPQHERRDILNAIFWIVFFIVGTVTRCTGSYYK